MSLDFQWTPNLFYMCDKNMNISTSYFGVIRFYYVNFKFKILFGLAIGDIKIFVSFVEIGGGIGFQQEKEADFVDIGVVEEE